MNKKNKEAKKEKNLDKHVQNNKFTLHLMLYFSVILVLYFLFRYGVNQSRPDESVWEVSTDVLVFGATIINLSIVAVQFNKQMQKEIDSKKAILRCSFHSQPVDSTLTEYWTIIKIHNLGLAAAYDMTLTAYFKDWNSNGQVESKIVDHSQIKYIVFGQNTVDVYLIKKSILPTQFEKIIIKYKDLSSKDFLIESIQFSK